MPGMPRIRGKWMTGSEVTEEVMAKQVATCLGSGMNLSNTAKELGISVKRVTTLSNTEKCKRTMLELSDAAVATAKAAIKAKTADMADLVISTIRRHLKEGNLNAVPIALKVLGFGEDKVESGPATITVILPGGEQPPSIVTDFKEVTS